MYASVGDFVESLAREGQLRRVAAPVDAVLEIAALADRASKSVAPGAPSASALGNDPRFAHLGGPALLLENVRGPGGAAYDMPVLINAWGSYTRMEMALGCHEGGHTPGGFDAIGARIAELVKPEPPRSLADLVSKARQFLPLLRIPPKRRRGLGPCQQVVHTGDGVDLRRLPLIRCWPHDGDFASLGYPASANEGIAALGRGPEWEQHHRGRYITLAGIHTIHADDRDNPRPPSHNIGMYRVQLLGPRTLAMHWHVHHDGARHWRSWKKLGRPMPVAIALGGESVMPYAATAPLPPGISELLLAGFLNRGGIPMVRCRTVPLWVPANAEIVIEGWVSHEAGPIGWDPREPSGGPLGPGAVFEGPFGDHTGFYSLPDRYPLLEVSAVTHRRDPVYVTTVVGPPPQEDYFLGKATERVFLPLLRTLIHDIEDYDLPMFGAFHNCAMLRIDKAYPLQARRVMHSVWGAGQMAWTKSLFVVDRSVDVHDASAVLSAAGRRCHPLRDVEIVRGPLDILDHAAPRLGAGAKIGFDCTARVDGEQAGALGLDAACTPLTDQDRRRLIEAVRAIPGVVAAEAPADAEGWLFVGAEKVRPRDGAAVIERLWQLAAEGLALPPYTVVLGPAVDPGDTDAAMFHLCAHADASRDLHRWASPDNQRHAIAFDATPKLPGDERNGEPVRQWPPLLSMPEQVARRAAEVLGF